MSQVLSHYPHLVPGLCGRQECPRICSRVEHCAAGLRRSRARLAARAMRRFSVQLDSRRRQVCERIHQAGLCPSLCHEIGGCFLPRVDDHPAEARRKVFRAQKAMDKLVRLRQLQALEANVVSNAGPFEAFSSQLVWERQQKGKEVLHV